MQIKQFCHGRRFRQSSQKAEKGRCVTLSSYLNFTQIYVDSSTLPPIRHLLESIDSTFTYQPEKSQLKIVNQPDPYQISNYNVQPTLAIELPYDMSECVITAELVLNFVVANGFQAGGTQVVPRNTRFIRTLSSISYKI